MVVIDAFANQILGTMNDACQAGCGADKVILMPAPAHVVVGSDTITIVYGKETSPDGRVLFQMRLQRRQFVG